MVCSGKRLAVITGGIVASIVLLVCTCLPSWAQLLQSRRYEQEIKYSDGTFTIIPMKEEGLFLISDKDKYEDGKKQWEVVVLDTALKERKTTHVVADVRSRFIGYEYAPGKMYLLYRVGDSDKSNLEVVQVNLNNDEMPRYTIESDLALHLTHFSLAGSGIVLGGYVNKEPAVLLYDLDNKAIKVLPGFFQKDTELVDLRVNLNHTFNVVMIDRALRDKQKLVFRTYDENGKILLEDEVPIDDKITLQTGITSTLEREDLAILGSWGEGNSKQSNGFFALPIDPFHDQKIVYTALAELKHYLDYVKPNRAKRIQDKTKEELAAGDIPNYVNYVTPYRIMEYKKGFIMLAEVYNPSSSSIFNASSNPYSPYYYNPYYYPYGMYYPGYGRFYSPPYSYGNNPRASGDIKSVQTVLVAFTPDGKVQWDYSMELDEVKRSALEQVSDFYYLNSEIVILYKKESELKAKRIDLEAGEVEDLTEKIRLNYPEDEWRSEREGEGDVRYWFGNTFYVWGYQSIRNATLEDRSRDVFYINKVEAR